MPTRFTHAFPAALTVRALLARVLLLIAHPRRALLDPLQPFDKPSWLVTRNMTGAVLDTEEIPAGADLTRRFAVTLLEWLDNGWDLGEFSSPAGTFFCTRGSERRMVGIQPTEPGQVHASGTSGLQSCPSCGD